MKKFKWPVALAAFVVVLVLSVSSVYLSRRQMVNEPLLRRLGQLEFVERVELERGKNIFTVTVQLGYVDDFSMAYRQLKTETDNQLGAGAYKLVVKDKRNKTLEAAFYAVHLTLYESEFRGNFTDMKKEAAEILKALGISEYRIMVDRDYIYLQLRDKEAYLYELIARDNDAGRGVEG